MVLHLFSSCRLRLLLVGKNGWHTSRWYHTIKEAHARIIICHSTKRRLTIVVVPGPGAQDTDSALLGTIDKTVTRIRVEARNVHIVISTQHG
jgi:hypothetical protein